MQIKILSKYILNLSCRYRDFSDTDLQKFFFSVHMWPRRLGRSSRMPPILHWHHWCCHQLWVPFLQYGYHYQRLVHPLAKSKLSSLCQKIKWNVLYLLGCLGYRWYRCFLLQFWIEFVNCFGCR